MGLPYKSLYIFYVESKIKLESSNKYVSVFEINLLTALFSSLLLLEIILVRAKQELFP